MTPLTWAGRLLAAAAFLAPAAPAAAQQPQPQINPGAFRQPPKADPKPNPKAGEQPKKPNPIIVHPQFNGQPAIPAWRVNPPAFNPGPFFNPALNNPWMNQTNLIPVTPFNNPLIANPFTTNPFTFAPLNNPLAPNPLVNNPFAFNAFNNPFATNPFAFNAFNNPFNNPFAFNAFNNPLQNQFPTAIIGSYGPVATYTPPLAIQQPGYLLWRGPDLQLNPWSGTVYRPLSGIARTADGSVFFRVPGTGLPTATGSYAPGTGLYFNPQGGTFLNPSSGVISRPGVTNVFIPWIPG